MHSFSGAFWIVTTPQTLVTGIEILCMDYRFEQEASEAIATHNVTFRNAGAMVDSMIPELDIIARKCPSATSLTIRTHTDCGAINFVHDVFQGRAKASSEIEYHLVSHFQLPIERSGRNPKDLTKSELEQLNSDMKWDALRPFASVHGLDLNISTAPRDLSEFNKPRDSNAVLLFTSPTNSITHAELSLAALGEKAEKTKVYLVQRASIWSAISDFEIAHFARINEIKPVSLGPEQDEYLSKAATQLRSREMIAIHPFLKEMDINPVPFNERFSLKDSDLRSTLRKEGRTRIRHT